MVQMLDVHRMQAGLVCVNLHIIAHLSVCMCVCVCVCMCVGVCLCVCVCEI